MKIGTLKEIKNNENRVGLTPTGTKQLVSKGHDVYVEDKAGNGAGFSNQDYIDAGAKILDSPMDVVNEVDILVKVKEPLEKEYPLLDKFKKKILFTYLHLTGVPKSLTLKLLENNITGIAYETVESKGTLPLLTPMSQVAGVLAVQYGAEYLQRKYDGRGITLGEIDNAPKAHVVVVGGGVVGTTSARTAAGMGVKVTLLEINDKKIEQLKQAYSNFPNMEIIKSTEQNLSSAVASADLLVGAVLVAGARAPVVVTEAMVKKMKKGAVIVDVAIDQGGCVFGTKATSHSEPIYRNEGGVIYCNVPNMPGQVALQSTQALTNSTLPYLVKLAENGFDALKEDPGFMQGLNTHKGKIANNVVARDLNMIDQYADFS